MPIIEGDLNAPFRGFIPPPPDEEDDESLILKPMPPPIMISDWWLTSIQTFVNGDDFVSSVRSKGKVRTKPQVSCNSWNKFPLLLHNRNDAINWNPLIFFCK